MASYPLTSSWLEVAPYAASVFSCKEKPVEVMPAIVLTGVGATACIDGWSWLRGRFLGVPASDFALVGRWIGHMPQGRFVQRPVSAASPVRGEGLLGWGAHYAIGIAFAALLCVVAGPAWFGAPTLVPALLVGVATVLAPWLLLQPGMGAGLFAWRAARPWQVRFHSLLTHALFGLGLYASAVLINHS
jgi:hypothetical protein